MKEFRERFYTFLTTDWVHMERRVSALDAQVKMVLSMWAVLIGLMVYAVMR